MAAILAFSRRRLHRDQRGSTYVEFLVQFFIVMVLVAGIITLYSIFTTHQHVVFMARRLVRAIEVTGVNDYNVHNLFLSLRDDLGLLAADFQVINVTYFPGGGQRIQLRDTFTVEVVFPQHLQFANVNGATIAIPFNHRVRLNGMSEVFWRP